LHNAKAVLFIYCHKAYIGKFHVFLQKCMRANYDLYIATFDFFFSFLFAFIIATF